MLYIRKYIMVIELNFAAQKSTFLIIQRLYYICDITSHVPLGRSDVLTYIIYMSNTIQDL